MPTPPINDASAIVGEDLQHMIDVAGIPLTPHQNVAASNGDVRPLVLVPSARHNLHSLALALVSQRPILLEGPVGSGKTTTVDHFAAMQRTDKVLKLQMGDQVSVATNPFRNKSNARWGRIGGRQITSGGICLY